jgi:hypothetical protein
MPKMGQLSTKSVIPNSRDGRVDREADVRREIGVVRRHQRAQGGPLERQAIRIANSSGDLPRRDRTSPHCCLMSHVAITDIGKAAQAAAGSEESRSAM